MDSFYGFRREETWRWRGRRRQGPRGLQGRPWLVSAEADHIRLITHDESPDGGTLIAARGDLGRLALVGFNQVNVASAPEAENFGAIGQGQYPPPFTGRGILIWGCDANDAIHIQRGAMSSPMNQTISLVSGEIVVDAGSMGTIILKAGNSYITIEQSRIMISAPTVSINGTPVTIN